MLFYFIHVECFRLLFCFFKYISLVIFNKYVYWELKYTSHQGLMLLKERKVKNTSTRREKPETFIQLAWLLRVEGKKYSKFPGKL